MFCAATFHVSSSADNADAGHSGVTKHIEGVER
jgi:hypothetical protein